MKCSCFIADVDDSPAIPVLSDLRRSLFVIANEEDIGKDD